MNYQSSRFAVYLKETLEVQEQHLEPTQIAASDKRSSLKVKEKSVIALSWRNLEIISQLIFTCSKSAIETLEKCVKYVHS